MQTSTVLIILILVLALLYFFLKKRGKPQVPMQKTETPVEPMKTEEESETPEG